MLDVLSVLAAAIDDPSKVSPGIAGFLTVFALALATWLLIRSMVGHLRKVRYRAEHEAARSAAEGTAPTGQGSGASGPSDDAPRGRDG